MSVTLYLLNKKGFEVLKALVQKNNLKEYVSHVVYGEDKKLDNDYSKEIKKICKAYGIPYYSRAQNIEIKSEYSIAIGWRWLIKDVKNLIVLHDSYLPHYRGFSPLVNMLINGENYVGVSSIYANQEMDKGEIIYQEKKNIEYPIKINKAIEIVSQLYCEIVTKIFMQIISGVNLKSYPQDESLATYSIWRDEEDYFIDWKDSAKKIKRFVDAVGTPYKGARTKTKLGDIIKINECEVVSLSIEIASPGKILMFKDEKPVVLCGQDAIQLIDFSTLNGENYHFKKFRTRFI